MYNIKNTKSFMDNVHGYIRIPKCFVENLIDNPEFQRLRNVDQTGMKVLYPNAKHDRFSHSLGVFHLGSIAVDALLSDLQDTSQLKDLTACSPNLYWAKNKVLFLIACLLHDIGHAPFSHSLERFYIIQPERALSDELKKLMQLDDTVNEEEISILNRSAEHEKVSAFLILSHVWKKRIKKTLNQLIDEGFPYLTNKHDEDFSESLPVKYCSDFDDDICFIARMITGVKYHDYDTEKQIRNCFIELLNGGIDVDKLDYIIRDTKMSGIGNVAIDVERLLGSLTIVASTVYSNYEFRESVSPEFNNALIQELRKGKGSFFEMYGVFDKFLNVSDGDVLIPNNTVFSLEVVEALEHQKKIYLLYERTAFTSDSDVYINKKQELSHKDLEITIPANTGDDRLELSKARLANVESSFKMTFPDNSNVEHKIRLHSFGDKPTQIDAEISLLNALFTGKLIGKIDYLKVLSGNHETYSIPPNENRFTSYSIGFKKQAINLISSVSDARNYLYLWIYSHHKVIYYANYLVIELARLSMPNIGEKKELQELLTENILQPSSSYMLDEDFVLSSVRDATKLDDCNKIPSFVNRYDELISRKYRNSLYKSLAEFDLLFNAYNRRRIKIKLSTISENECNNLDAAFSSVAFLKYGKIKPCVISTLRCSADTSIDEIIEDILWVEANPSIKINNPADILISFTLDKSVTTMDRLHILNVEPTAKSVNYSHHKDYFYFYFSLKASSSYKKDELLDIARNKLKEALLLYFNDCKSDD